MQLIGASASRMRDSSYINAAVNVGTCFVLRINVDVHHPDLHELVWDRVKRNSGHVL